MRSVPPARFVDPDALICPRCREQVLAGPPRTPAARFSHSDAAPLCRAATGVMVKPTRPRDDWTMMSVRDPVVHLGGYLDDLPDIALDLLVARFPACRPPLSAIPVLPLRRTYVDMPDGTTAFGGGGSHRWAVAVEGVASAPPWSPTVGVGPRDAGGAAPVRRARGRLRQSQGRAARRRSAPSSGRARSTGCGLSRPGTTQMTYSIRRWSLRTSCSSPSAQ